MNNRDNHDDRDDDETSTERQERLRKEKELKNTIRVIRSSLFVIESIFNRQRRVDDPVVRYSLFVEKLLMIVDMGLGASKGFISDDKYPDDLRNKVDELTASLQSDLEDLLKWIRHPVYSPDHPYGNGFMTASKEDFELHVKIDEDNMSNDPQSE